MEAILGVALSEKETAKLSDDTAKMILTFAAQDQIVEISSTLRNLHGKKLALEKAGNNPMALQRTSVMLNAALEAANGVIFFRTVPLRQPRNTSL